MMHNSIYSIFFMIVISSGAARNLPRFADLDEEDQQLFRAAYDTPSYEPPHYNDYQEEDLNIGKLDLVKDGLWAIKAKLKELKAFDKALAANLLSTKLKVKELLKHPSVLKIEKKPVHHYQPPEPAYPHYAPAQYEAKPAQYAPAQYVAKPAQYAPAQYEVKQEQYAPQYEPQPPAQQYTHSHDPYYGY